MLPQADQFPPFPRSWYVFGVARDLGRRPTSREMLGRKIVGFRTTDGAAILLDARCAHFGGDLGQGCVVGDSIRCPLHHWEYGSDGRCVHIPATSSIPPHARQMSFPVVERHGFVFFFNGPEPLFPLPFFPGVSPDELVAARPFETVLRCPWFLVGANHFDLQHFRTTHERRLVGEPDASCSGPFARSGRATFRVEGTSLLDRLTRRFAGPEVTLRITDWCGNLMFTTADFRRTRSYGMVALEPLGDGGVRVQVVVYLPAARGLLGAASLPLRLAIRRHFIREFLRGDMALLDGQIYQSGGLIECDQGLADYLNWLAIVAHGAPFADRSSGNRDRAARVSTVNEGGSV